MTPTAAAPAGSSIEVSLEAEDDNGTNGAKLELQTKGLSAGTYFVSVTLKSDGSTVTLGSFTLSGGDADVEFSTEGEDDNEEASFPANLNPLDIATISVSDANNVVLFTADLTTLSAVASMNLNASVQATHGPAAPSAAGSAMLTAFVSHGQAKGSLQFNAQGLPANMQLVVTINGITANVKKAKTDKSGNASIHIGPKGKTGTVAPGVTMFQINSVRLMDKSGNVLLSADF
jgi:hypothetical protein